LSVWVTLDLKGCA